MASSFGGAKVKSCTLPSLYSRILCYHLNVGTRSDTTSVTGCTGVNPHTLVLNTSSQNRACLRLLGRVPKSVQIQGRHLLRNQVEQNRLDSMRQVVILDKLREPIHNSFLLQCGGGATQPASADQSCRSKFWNPQCHLDRNLPGATCSGLFGSSRKSDAARNLNLESGWQRLPSIRECVSGRECRTTVHDHLTMSPTK